MLTVQCPRCSRVLMIPEQYVGQTVACSCRQPLAITSPPQHVPFWGAIVFSCIILLVLAVVVIGLTGNRGHEPVPIDPPAAIADAEQPAQAAKLNLPEINASPAPATRPQTTTRPEPIDVGTLHTWELKVGQAGVLPNSESSFFKVVQIFSVNEMLLQHWASEQVSINQFGQPVGPFVDRPGSRFVVKGLSTEGVADGQRMELLQRFQVTTTRRFGGSTYMVIEPITDR